MPFFVHDHPHSKTLEMFYYTHAFSLLLYNRLPPLLFNVYIRNILECIIVAQSSVLHWSVIQSHAFKNQNWFQLQLVKINIIFFKFCFKDLCETETREVLPSTGSAQQQQQRGIIRIIWNSKKKWRINYRQFDIGDLTLTSVKTQQEKTTTGIPEKYNQSRCK
jgi:hypothetical protein